MILLNLFINHFRYKKIVEKNKFIIIFNLIDYFNILFFIEVIQIFTKHSCLLIFLKKIFFEIIY